MFFCLAKSDEFRHNKEDNMPHVTMLGQIRIKTFGKKNYVFPADDRISRIIFLHHDDCITLFIGVDSAELPVLLFLLKNEK